MPDSEPTEVKTQEHFLDTYSKAVLDPLIEQNKRLEKRINDEWKIARGAFVLVTMLAAVFFGVKLAYEFYVTMKINSANTKFVEKMDDFETTLQHQKRLMVSEFNGYVNKQSGILDGKVTSMESKLNEINDENLELKKHALLAVTASHKVVSYVNLARHHLINNSDSSRAVYYSDLANRELEMAIALLERSKRVDLSEVKTSLKNLRPVVWTVQAEHLFQKLDFENLEKLSLRMTQEDCDCVEGNFYYAFVLLHKYLSDDSIGNGFEQVTENLDKSKSSNDKIAPGRLLLAAVHFLDGNPTKTILETKTIIDALGKPESPQFVFNSEREKAYSLIAETLRRIAALALDDEQNLEPLPAYVCNMDAGSLGRPIGDLFDSLFMHIAKNRNQFFPGDRNANLGGLYLANAIVPIRHSCGKGVLQTDQSTTFLATEGCSNCVGGYTTTNPTYSYNNLYVTNAVRELATELRLMPMPNFLFSVGANDFELGEKKIEIVFPVVSSETTAENYTVLVPYTETVTSNATGTPKSVATTKFRLETRTRNIPGFQVQLKNVSIDWEEHADARSYLLQQKTTDLLFPTYLAESDLAYLQKLVSEQKFGFSVPEIVRLTQPIAAGEGSAQGVMEGTPVPSDGA